MCVAAGQGHAGGKGPVARVFVAQVRAPDIRPGGVRSGPAACLEVVEHLLNLLGVPRISTLRVLDEIASLNSRGPMIYKPTTEDLAVADLESWAQEAAAAQQPRTSRAKRQPLGRPDGTDPDSFYSQVAQAYREYGLDSRAPAAAIAEEASRATGENVPASTAHRWIREARRRGFLEAGTKGKAG
jgi:hypothetical protein